MPEQIRKLREAHAARRIEAVGSAACPCGQTFFTAGDYADHVEACPFVQRAAEARGEPD
jgi:hypothetical protein